MARKKAPAGKRSPRTKRAAKPKPTPARAEVEPEVAEAPIELGEPEAEPERPGAGPPTPIYSDVEDEPTEELEPGESGEAEPEPEPEPELESEREEPEDPEPEPRPLTFRATLIDGGRYSVGGYDFVHGRPVTSTDLKLYERLRFNGRFRVDVV